MTLTDILLWFTVGGVLISALIIDLAALTGWLHRRW